MRADYEDEHGEEMSLAQLYEDAHKRKDGSFVKDTSTEVLSVDTKAKAEMLKMLEASKSRKELEVEAFVAVNVWRRDS